MTAAYIFWALLAVGFWIVILNWKEGYPCKQTEECTEKQRIQILKETEIEKMRNER